MEQYQNDLELRAKARAELIRLKKEERYRFYTPNGKAEQLIRMVGQGYGEVFASNFSAANGVGKTAVGCNIVAHIVFGCTCEWFDYPIYRNWPKDWPKRGRIASDPTTIKNTIVPELHTWFPKGRYATSKESKEYEAKWETDTGWVFDLLTYDQDTKEFESVTLGWHWFDEPPPEDKYKAGVSRMRRGGIVFITQTPLSGSAWMYDKFITSSDRIDLHIDLDTGLPKEQVKTHILQGV